MRELKLRNGMRFVTKSSQDRFAIEGMFYRKAWTKFYKIKNDDTVIDIGAFIGDFATFAASSAKNVKVFAYEPSRKSFEYLVKNTKLNNLDSNIIPFNLAVTNIKKKIKIYLNPDCESAGDSMYLSSSLPYDLVKSTTLKDIFEFNKIKYCNFLKINCEGAEFDILLSTPKKIFKKIGYIAVEYHWIGGKTKRDYDAIIQTLRNNNFKIEHEFTKEDGGYIFAGADN
jgi:FkbM family methyltransferase